MKLSIATGIGFVAFVAIAVMFAKPDSFTSAPPAAIDSTTTASVGLTDLDTPTFLISSAGSSTKCKAFPQENGLPGHDALRMTSDCATLYPPLANATEWHNNQDGTIAFADHAGHTIVEFSPGDGLAYVSIEPRSVLLSLSARGVNPL
ncbi:hypothetical protein HB779_20485 [Phyllobacterium sp. 628]|uniref:hypothetical protein n=1 Tax=Phyllobacterium sp. 628 TaxID=2718938 RepID=UPI00166246F0|nr:hypothetical protein [Phyllobacterium sp. 628]QND54002.1 hypothetical protein HB779_20485 [Phyllobacterium sp. 628]